MTIGSVQGPASIAGRHTRIGGTNFPMGQSDEAKKAWKIVGGILAAFAVLTLLPLLDSDYPSSTRTPSPSSPQTSSRLSKPIPKMVSLRIAVFNDTKSTPHRTEVWVRGSGSWYPNLEFGSDVRVFEGFEVGSSTSGSIVFYPLGRDEPEIPVSIPITSNLCAQGCVRDMVQLAIHDDYFEVIGPGTQQRY